MPANNEYPILDGIAPSWADVSVRLSLTGAPLIDMRDIKALNSGRTVEVGAAKSGGRVKRRTTGDSNQEASWTLYRHGFQSLLRGLIASPNCPRRGEYYLVSLVHFDVQVLHTPPGSVEVFERVWKGCRVLTDAVNGSEGTDADTCEVGLSTIEIYDVIDGKKVVLL